MSAEHCTSYVRGVLNAERSLERALQKMEPDSLAGPDEQYTISERLQKSRKRHSKEGNKEHRNWIAKPATKILLGNR